MSFQSLAVLSQLQKYKKSSEVLQITIIKVTVFLSLHVKRHHLQICNCWNILVVKITAVHSSYLGTVLVLLFEEGFSSVTLSRTLLQVIKLLLQLTMPTDTADSTSTVTHILNSHVYTAERVAICLLVVSVYSDMLVGKLVDWV